MENNQGAGQGACGKGLTRKRVIPAPRWLVKRMKLLAALPPPTLAEVKASFEGSERWRQANVISKAVLVNKTKL